MRHFAQAFVLLGAAIFFAPFTAISAAAEPTYEEFRHCLDSPTQGNRAAGDGWWSRRSAQEQRYMIELPCEEKYIVAICVFLYDPDLKGCTNKGVARFRADRYCAAQGHEILSEERAACSQEYVANFKPVF